MLIKEECIRGMYTYAEVYEYVFGMCRVCTMMRHGAIYMKQYTYNVSTFLVSVLIYRDIHK